MTKKCTLCYDDGWITDSIADFKLCTPDEHGRFKNRLGILGGAAEGRMACPRCQPDWEKRDAERVARLYAIKEQRRWWQFWR